MLSLPGGGSGHQRIRSSRFKWCASLGVCDECFPWAAGVTGLARFAAERMPAPRESPRCGDAREVPRDLHTHEFARGSAGFEDVRILDLRHRYRSAARELGVTLPMIGPLLGQREIETTVGYAHLARDFMYYAATSIANRIADDIP